MITIAVIEKQVFINGPTVTCDMSLLANCVAQNLFLVSTMSFLALVTLKIVFYDLQPPCER